MRKHESCLATEAPQSWHVARFGTNKVTTTVVVTFAGKEILFCPLSFMPNNQATSRAFTVAQMEDLNAWWPTVRALFIMLFITP